jgi:hypothetical protein
MKDPEMLIGLMVSVYDEQSMRKTAENMLRIVLQSVQRGEVVNVDMDYNVYLKPYYKEWMEK